MQVVVLMQVGQAFQDLLQDTLELSCVPFKLVVYEACQIVRDKLENEVDPVVLPLASLRRILSS